MKKLFILSSFLFLVGCQQLPNRTDVSLMTEVPNFKEGTIIPSSNGLLSEGLNQVPGSICIPDKNTGKCDLSKLSPSPCIISGSKTEVKPIANPQPAFHLLVNDKFKADATVPFISPTTSGEHLYEIKATISGFATVNGYPGPDGIKKCILDTYGPGNYEKVYWIRSANIISVSKSTFVRVENSTSVTSMAFGFNGSTYNHSGYDEQSIWIGILPFEVNIGTVSAATIPAINSVVMRTENSTTTIVSPPSAPIPIPEPIRSESIVDTTR